MPCRLRRLPPCSLHSWPRGFHPRSVELPQSPPCRACFSVWDSVLSAFLLLATECLKLLEPLAWGSPHSEPSPTPDPAALRCCGSPLSLASPASDGRLTPSGLARCLGWLLCNPAAQPGRAGHQRQPVYDTVGLGGGCNVHSQAQHVVQMCLQPPPPNFPPSPCPGGGGVGVECHPSGPERCISGSPDGEGSPSASHYARGGRKSFFVWGPSWALWGWSSPPHTVPGGPPVLTAPPIPPQCSLGGRAAPS